MIVCDRNDAALMPHGGGSYVSGKIRCGEGEGHESNMKWVGQTQGLSCEYDPCLEPHLRD